MLMPIYEHPWTRTSINPSHVSRLSESAAGENRDIPVVRLYLADGASEFLIVGKMAIVERYLNGGVDFNDYVMHVENLRTSYYQAMSANGGDSNA